MPNGGVGQRGQREYYERLQSFRGFGVLMVAFYHCQGIIGGELPMHPVPERHVGMVQVAGHYLALCVLNGHAALMAFFVLSGFVLTLSLRRGPQGAVPASLAFVGGRIFRIMPANAVAVLVAVGIATIAGAAPQAKVPPPWEWSHIFANATLVQTTINPVAWSLVVELLAAPCIVGMYLVTRRSGPLPLTVAAAVALVLSFAPGWLGYRPLSRNLFACFAGMLVAEMGPRAAGGMTRRQAAVAFLFALALWFPSRALLGRWSHFASVAEVFAAATMMALLVYGPQLSSYRVFAFRPILWLGEISFSLYLYHYMLMALFTFPADGRMFAWLGGWAPLGALVVAWVVTVALTVPIAALAYAAVERTGIAVGRMVTRRWSAGKVAPFVTRDT